MPPQPLLPARRPRADSVADPGVDVEAPADVVPVAPPAEVPVQAGLPVPAAEAPSEGAVAPASKKARQYDLPPQQPDAANATATASTTDFLQFAISVR